MKKAVLLMILVPTIAATEPHFGLEIGVDSGGQIFGGMTVTNDKTKYILGVANTGPIVGVRKQVSQNWETGIMYDFKHLHAASVLETDGRVQLQLQNWLNMRTLRPSHNAVTLSVTGRSDEDEVLAGSAEAVGEPGLIEDPIKSGKSTKKSKKSKKSNKSKKSKK